jgi:hypothetical protein
MRRPSLSDMCGHFDERFHWIRPKVDAPVELSDIAQAKVERFKIAEHLAKVWEFLYCFFKRQPREK